MPYSQVSDLLDEDQRAAMKFFIAPVFKRSRNRRIFRPPIEMSSLNWRSKSKQLRKETSTDTTRTQAVRPRKRTKLGLALESSAKEILSHLKGEARFPVSRVVLPGAVDVKRIRRAARMSQAEFARAFCINPRTLQEWE